MVLNILQCAGQSFTTNIMAPNVNSAEDEGNPSLGLKTFYKTTWSMSVRLQYMKFLLLCECDSLLDKKERQGEEQCGIKNLR